jgi:hypothetical protein
VTAVEIPASPFQSLVGIGRVGGDHKADHERTTNAMPAIMGKRAVTEVVLVVALISDPP